MKKEMIYLQDILIQSKIPQKKIKAEIENV